jgi:acetolactate synthase-1/2/3 large subunit
LMGLGCFPGDHPLSLGMLGLHGTRYANQAVTECDCLIAVGARFDDRVVSKISGFAPAAKIIHIDIDPAEIGKNVRIQLPIVGDVKNVLGAMLPQLAKKVNPSWIERISRLKEEMPLRYKQDGALKPQFVLEKLNEYKEDSDIVVTDVGQHQMWAAQYMHFNKPRSFISSGGLGAMGFCLPAAIGAKLGAPDRTVIMVTGDGGLQMTMQELGTAAVLAWSASCRNFIVKKDILPSTSSLTRISPHSGGSTGWRGTLSKPRSSYWHYCRRC